MKSLLLTVMTAAVLCALPISAYAGNSSISRSPTRAEVLEYSLRNGPSTPHPESLSWRRPATGRAGHMAYNGPLRPLTRREIGMLFGARTAYAESLTAYDSTRRLYRGLVEAGLFKADARVAAK